MTVNNRKHSFTNKELEVSIVIISISQATHLIDVKALTVHCAELVAWETLLLGELDWRLAARVAWKYKKEISHLIYLHLCI